MRTARRNRNVPAGCGSSPSIAERAYDSVSRNADMANSTSTTSNRVSSENTGLVVWRDGVLADVEGDDRQGGDAPVALQLSGAGAPWGRLRGARAVAPLRRR